MPRIARWAELPTNVRGHLADRMGDRAITLEDLNQLRLWIASEPEVPEGEWYKDFGSFKICGEGPSALKRSSPARHSCQGHRRQRGRTAARDAAHASNWVFW